MAVGDIASATDRENSPTYCLKEKQERKQNSKIQLTIGILVIIGKVMPIIAANSFGADAFAHGILIDINYLHITIFIYLVMRSSKEDLLC